MQCGTLVPRSCLTHKLPNWPHRQSLAAIHAARLGPYPQSRAGLDPSISSATPPVMSSVTLHDWRCSRTSTSCSPPTHFLGDPDNDDWFMTDRESCVLLREALEREGGKNVAIDYPVIIPHTELNNAAFRGGLTAALPDLPIDSVWIRASGLDPNSGALTVRRYLTAISHFHNLGKPIVADYLGGLVGGAALAFGVVSGVAHGINERGRFDASSWHKPPPQRADDTRFGRPTRISIPGLNRSVTLEGPMTAADRLARQIKNLKPPVAEAGERGIDVTKLMGRLSAQSRRLEQLSDALQHLHDERGNEAPRARAVRVRDAKSDAKKEERR
jgi:hypothetical protein